MAYTSPGGRILAAGCIGAVAGLVLIAKPQIGWAQFTCTGTCTSTSETRSETVVSVTTNTSVTNQTVVPGSGPLPGLLTQMINGPNGGATLSALGNVMGSGAVSQTTATTTTTTAIATPTGTPVVGTYLTFGGPVVIPVGAGPGTMNCNGAPSPPSGTGVWPVSNCNFAGYQTLLVNPGSLSVNTNTHFFFLTDLVTQINIVNTTQVNLTAQGFNWLSGDLHTTFQTTILDDDFRFMDFLLGRGASVGTGSGAVNVVPLGFSAEPAMAAAPFEQALAYATKAPRMMPAAAPIGGWSAWARGSLGYARYDTTAANFGFDAKSRSGELGVEYARESWLIGGAAGFGRAEVSQLRTGDSGRIDSVRAGAYGAFMPGPWRFSGAVAGGFHAIDATRLALLPGPARSSYDAQSISAGIEAARRFAAFGGVVEPLGGLVYSALHVDGFTEAGNGFLDLAGRGTTIDALKGYLGVRAHRTTMVGSAAFTPELRARVLHDFLDDVRGYTARFTADPTATALPVTGIQPGRTAALLGGGVTLQITPGWRAFAAYDAELRRNAISHLGSAGVKVSW
jgi:outer membrane autotransporter protein